MLSSNPILVSYPLDDLEQISPLQALHELILVKHQSGASINYIS